MLKVEFEGTDGAGKTTGLKYFIEEAKKRNLTVVETREVGNPHIPSCVKMREFVLDPKSNLTGTAMELIFSAMRMENDLWLTNLGAQNGAPDLVVSDRGWFSHLAYTDHNVSKDFTNLLYNGVVEKITAMPDVVIYFSVSTEVALARRIKRGEGMDVIEMKGIEYQELVRDSFEKHLEKFVKNNDNRKLFIVNANTSLERVKEQLDSVLDQIQESIGKA